MVFCNPLLKDLQSHSYYLLLKLKWLNVFYRKQETNEESTNLETLKIKMEPQSQNSVSNGSSNIKMASVKTESTLQIPRIPEPNGQNLTIKEEPNSMAESQSLSGESAVLNIKCESESPIKRESQTIPINRKKVKKLF